MIRNLQFLVLLISLNGFSQVYLNPEATVEERVSDLLSRMTLEEKIGQMTQAEREFIGADGGHIKTYFLGSILSGGGSSPGNSVESWVDMYNQFQQQAMDTRLAIPIIYGTDAVHGNNNLYGAVLFPHNIGLGCTRNADLVEECSKITAIEVAATGVDWTFSPCITVPRNERWGRTYEGYSEDPDLVAVLGEASINGYQFNSLSDSNSILACAKHFIADGGTEEGIDQGNAILNETELRDIHLKPYYNAINANVGSVMASFNSWNGEKCHGSEYLLTDILKTELSFNGFIVSDWKAINQLGDFKTAIGQAVNAGVDMAMQPNDYISFIQYLTELVDEQVVPLSRIDDAVCRILKIKFEMGLFEKPYADYSMVDSVGNAYHRAVGRQAVRESLVLLQNNNSVLPMSKSADVVVVGSKADNMGVQCGGWSIYWQGGQGNITPGTTIKEAITNVVGAGNVNYTTTTTIPDGDVAVVVVGEDPYAEGDGDVPYGSDKFYISSEDQLLIEAVKAKGLPMIVLLLTGRPIMLEDLLSDADAVVAAWLPGTEGQGIADMLFGDYEFVGLLSHSWPRNEDMVPVNYGDSNYDPLFEYGFGLRYNYTNSNNITDKNGLNLYPNPVVDVLHIHAKQVEMVNVIDITGNIILSKAYGFEDNVQLNIASLKKGVYFIEVQSEASRMVKQIVKY